MIVIMMFDTNLTEMKPIKLIVLNKGTTNVEQEYERLPKIYKKLVELSGAYYYYSDVVIEVLGRDLLIRKSIKKDYLNISKRYIDNKSNKLILIEEEPVKIKGTNAVLDLISSERTYKDISEEGLELFNLLTVEETDLGLRNSTIVRQMVEREEIILNLYSNTLLSRIVLRANKKSYNFYEFMNVLNLKIINSR